MGVLKMAPSDCEFFQSVLTAGAIISGFCGSFLVFRIQREAEYYRVPRKHWNQQHFTPSLLLLSVATIGAFIFGVCLPLLALAKACAPLCLRPLIAAGLIWSVFTLGAYIVDELVHYRILYPVKKVRFTENATWLRRIIKLDAYGFRRERLVWIGGLIAPLLFAAASFWFLTREPQQSVSHTIPRPFHKGKFCTIAEVPVNKGLGMLQISVAKRKA
jgi:hypothetical protein